MAPMISSKKIDVEKSNFFDHKLLKQRENLVKLRNHVEKNFEFVGDKFGEKIRELYYDKKSKKVFMEPLPQRKEKN